MPGSGTKRVESTVITMENFPSMMRSHADRPHGWAVCAGEHFSRRRQLSLGDAAAAIAVHADSPETARPRRPSSCWRPCSFCDMVGYPELEKRIRELEEKVRTLQEENQHLRHSARAFGDLGERLNVSLDAERRGPQTAVTFRGGPKIGAGRMPSADDPSAGA